jgi:hypothetical protein
MFKNINLVLRYKNKCIIIMENLNDIIEFVPNSPVVLPEVPMKLIGVVNTDGLSTYSFEE